METRLVIKKAGGQEKLADFLGISQPAISQPRFED